jgi:hypothetical protein
MHFLTLVWGIFSLAFHFKGFLGWTCWVSTIIGGRKQSWEHFAHQPCGRSISLYLFVRTQECRTPFPQDARMLSSLGRMGYPHIRLRYLDPRRRILEDLLWYFYWCHLVPSFEALNNVIAGGGCNLAMLYTCHQNCFRQSVDREHKRMNACQTCCMAVSCGFLWTLHIAESWDSDSANRNDWI